MYFLHLADLHLGKTLGEYDLIGDQRYILDEVLNRIRLLKQTVKEDPVLLIAGDVYDKSIPSEAAVNLFDYFLRELAKEHVGTFVISGNHDSDDRLNFGSSFFEQSGIYIASVFDGKLRSCTLKDAYGEIDVWLLPFVKASQVRHFYPDEKIVTYEDAVRVIVNHAQIDPERRNVLVAHQFVTEKSGQDPRLSGSEGLSVQSVGLVEKIGSDVFDAFDYAALGHIHSGQPVGREEVRYSGSPLKYSLSEVNSEKTLPVIRMEKKGDTDITLYQLRPLRDLRHIKGRMKDLLDPAHVVFPEDFIYATLTDEDLIPEAMTIFRQTYPYMIRIDYDNAHTRQITDTDQPVPDEIRSFSEMISDFYRRMYGCDISDEELKIMKEMAGKAGVDHEAG